MCEKLPVGAVRIKLHIQDGSHKQENERDLYNIVFASYQFLCTVLPAISTEYKVV